MSERVASCGNLYDTNNLLLRYCNDDNVSAGSGMEMDDRLSHLEQRVQLQEDEIQLLKAALADALRRLGCCEEITQTSSKKHGPTKVRQILQALPSKPLTNGYVQTKRLSGYPSSPSSPKKEVLMSIKRKSMSTERLSTVKKEMADSRSRTTSSGSSTSGKRDSKTKECTFNADDGYVRMFIRGRPITMHVPDQQKEAYNLDHKVALPERKLKLQWVYGYRGRDCRCNLYLLPTGEIVYFNASVVVLYNVEEQQQRHYLGHNDDVKCLAIHPDMVTIATGQVAGTSKDGKLLQPHVRIWDSVSLNTLHVIGAGVFDRAATCVAFSKSNGGAHLCVVDDANDHILSVWDWQKEKQLAEVKCSNDSVLGAVFHPMEANLIVTCGKSHINFWTMEGSTLTKRQGLFEKHEKPKYVLCIAFAENGDAITGDSSGNIYIWAKGGNRISQVVSGAHEGGIFSLCVLKDGTLVSGGGKDRRVLQWDHDYRKKSEIEVPEAFGPVRTLAEGKQDELFVGTTRNAVLRGSFSGSLTPIVQGHTDELWGLDVHPSTEQFVTCGQDKQVYLWDTTSHLPLWSKAIEDPGRSIGFHPKGPVLAVGTMTGRWLVLDTDTRDLVSMHTDGNEIISVIKYSPDGAYLAVGSHDNFVYVYSVTENGRKYSRVGKCTGHSSFVTHLDWSTNSQFIVTNSGDYEILYWEASSGKHVTSADAVRNLEWATSTCVLGFNVFGIWPEGADGTDINAVCRSHDNNLLASADDFGKVHLFSNPCSQPRAPSHVYGGHSSHVTNVAFLHDDSHLISTGGKDTSILQWVLA
ncbi:echinoderm microtubule-associated protein-like 2 isoform X1 [Pimephales promelas]|uniref:echinoderm microtubule-associated protein-like 2 isoform X1 n=1 Tax=Pimephales promelas TaxID=90988 RepID=UPI001955EB1A|nr:echinoderm microtubule-associated protein-like 2 isoform X1 [Pimephales promelas]KAG1929889.1 echinoderm microtubule-associated protein-like [Pimephales promelas]